MTDLEILGAMLAKSLEFSTSPKFDAFLQTIYVPKELDEAQYKLWESLGCPIFAVEKNIGSALNKPHNNEAWTKEN